MAGYNAGRTIALRSGSAEAGHRWLNEHSEADIAYVAGYEWALWDYEDPTACAMNGAQRPLARESTPLGDTC
jgi:hypothetical protein